MEKQTSQSDEKLHKSRKEKHTNCICVAHPFPNWKPQSRKRVMTEMWWEGKNWEYCYMHCCLCPKKSEKACSRCSHPKCKTFQGRNGSCIIIWVDTEILLMHFPQKKAASHSIIFMCSMGTTSFPFYLNCVVSHIIVPITLLKSNIRMEK